jgi:3-isopropylmalate/(R)-2-methylmalate dehydratase small subunit
MPETFAMKPFKTHSGVVAPLDRANVDTDAIVPKQFLRKIERSGFGKHLFHEWRYLDYAGTQPNPDFVLNRKEYRQATILLTRDNFGCGSSREHAPWALADYGFRVIIAPSFADIFFSNCIKNGILLVRLQSAEVAELFAEVRRHVGTTLTADLQKQIVETSNGRSHSFPMDNFSKHCLIEGLDHIGWTLQFKDKIDAYEKQLRQKHSWF